MARTCSRGPRTGVAQKTMPGSPRAQASGVSGGRWWWSAARRRRAGRRPARILAPVPPRPGYVGLARPGPMPGVAPRRRPVPFGRRRCRVRAGWPPAETRGRWPPRVPVDRQHRARRRHAGPTQTPAQRRDRSTVVTAASQTPSGISSATKPLRPHRMRLPRAATPAAGPSSTAPRLPHGRAPLPASCGTAKGMSCQPSKRT